MGDVSNGPPNRALGHPTQRNHECPKTLADALQREERKCLASIEIVERATSSDPQFSAECPGPTIGTPMGVATSTCGTAAEAREAGQTSWQGWAEGQVDVTEPMKAELLAASLIQSSASRECTPSARAKILLLSTDTKDNHKSLPQYCRDSTRPL